MMIYPRVGTYLSISRNRNKYVSKSKVSKGQHLREELESFDGESPLGERFLDVVFRDGRSGNIKVTSDVAFDIGPVR